MISSRIEKKQLRFAERNWDQFSTRMIYQTSCEAKLVPELHESIFVYSIHKIKEVRIIPESINSTYFKVFKAKITGLVEPAGFVFIPNRLGKNKIKYSPVSLIVTSETATVDAVSSSEKRVLLKNDYLEMYWLSCGCEVITDLGVKLGISL